MQDRLEAVTSSLQNCISKMSTSSQATSSISVISSTKPKVCNDYVALVSKTSETNIKNNSVKKSDNEKFPSKTLGFQESVLAKLAPGTHVNLLLLSVGNILNCKSNGVLKMIDIESALNLFDGMRELNEVLKPCHAVRDKVFVVLSSPLKFYTKELEDKFLNTSIDGRLKYACTILANMCTNGVLVGYMTCDKPNKVLTMYWKMVSVFDPGDVPFNDNSPSVIGAAAITLMCISSLLWGLIVLITGTYSPNYTARHQMHAFMFKHGRYTDACLLLFLATGILNTQQNSSPNLPASSQQQADLLAMSFGTIDDLCYIYNCYGVMSVWEDIISVKYASAALLDATMTQFQCQQCCTLHPTLGTRSSLRGRELLRTKYPYSQQKTIQCTT